jgi:hypothetical protein
LPWVLPASRSRALQSELAHVVGHRLALCAEYPVEMSARTAELPGDQLRAQAGRCQVSLDEHLRRRKLNSTVAAAPVS